MIRVYIASKIIYAKRFRDLREAWKADGIHLHARWHDQAEYEEDASPAEFKIFWLVDEEDVCDAQAVIVYGEREDKLRGALIEAGIGIAKHKLVIIVGDCLDFGSWQHHPMVVRAGSLDHAKCMILHRFRPV